MNMLKLSFQIVFCLLLASVFLNIISLHKVDLIVNLVASSCYLIILIIWPYIQPKHIRLIRYADWSITVPLLLLSISKWARKENKIIITKRTIGMMASALAMILFGYLGKDSWQSPYYYLGFGAFALMAYFLYYEMELEKENDKKQDKNKQKFKQKRKQKLAVYISTLIVWSLYGLVYMIHSSTTKNMCYNILDLLSKGGLALFLFLN